MTSTRNKNTREDYALEQATYNDVRMYQAYQYASQGSAYINSIPTLAITPSRMPRDALSYNAVDIESYLRGTGSVNLVEPQKPIQPQLREIPMTQYFERLPVIMPKPLIVEKNQRPFPIAS
jgi:hypothetical protein